MSPKFEKILEYYRRGLWSIAKLRNAVAKGWITTSEFNIITGQA